MYNVTGNFEYLSQKDIEILQSKGFTVQNMQGNTMRTVASANPVPVMVNNQAQVVTVLPTPDKWADYTKDFNALFGKKFTAQIASNITAGAVAFGGYYENDLPTVANAGYVRDGAGSPLAVAQANVIISEFTQSQFGSYIKAAATEIPTLAKFARFVCLNPVAVVAMRITNTAGTGSAQLTAQPSYFEKQVTGEVKEVAIATVAKPAITTNQFQAGIVDIQLPEPFVLDGSSFITYPLLAAGNFTLEIAYTEVGNLVQGIERVKALKQKYDKIVCS